MMSRTKVLLLCLFITFTQKINASETETDDFTPEQEETLESFENIGGYVFMMDYKNNYYLSELLKANVTKTRELETFATNHLGVHNFDILNEGSNYDYECSGFNFFGKGGRHYTGRNFDYNDLYDYSYNLIYWTHPDGDYESLSTIDLYMVNYFDYEEPIDRLLLVPYFPMDGINEKGLFISILAVADVDGGINQQDENKYTIYAPLMLRAVLDKCATVEEAINLFKKYNMIDSSNHHFYITDANGDAVVIEYVDNEMKLFYPTNEECEQCLAVTNFLLSEDSDEDTYGMDRWQTMDDAITDNEGVLTWKKGMKILEQVSKNNTLYSNLYSHTGNFMLHAPHLDYEFIYNFSLSKPCEYTTYNLTENPYETEDFTKSQEETLSSFKQISDYVFMMDYKNDYYLDDLLKANVTSTRKLESFATKHLGIHNFDILNEEGDYSYECSGFNFFSEEGEHYTGRNFDYDDWYDYSYNLIYWTHPDGDYESLSTIDLYMVNYFNYGEPIDRLLLVPYFPMDGINEKGLFISVLVVAEGDTVTQTDENKYSIYAPLMLRAVLDKCATVDEAIELFEKYNMIDYSNHHFYITDAEGDAVVIEFFENKMKLVYPTNEKNDQCLAVTNFYLSQTSDENIYGKDRWQIMDDVITENEGILEWDDGMLTLKHVSKSNTLYSNLYNHDGKYVLHGPHLNYEIIYNFTLNKPCKYTTFNFSENLRLDGSSFINRSFYLLILALLIILF